MKILFLTNQLDVGGIETNIVRLTRSLSNRGHACIVGARPGSLSSEVSDAGGRTLALAMRPRPLALARDALALRRALAEEQPDVVHVFSATAAAVAWLPLRTISDRPPVVASVMGLFDEPNESQSSVRRRTKRVIAGADRVVVMAPAIGEVVRSLGLDEAHVIDDTVVGVEAARPVSTDRRRAVRSSLGLDESVPIVTTVGRLEPRKSPELFVEAAATVLRTRPDVVFLVVGDGALEDRVRRHLDELGIARSFRLLGSRRDVEDLMVATDVYVRPGVVEGFIGITVLEAQAVGTPVVSFCTDDVQLAIEDGVSGLLARNGDAGDLADCIGRLLDDRELATEIGRAGRARFHERYELEGVVDRLEALYASLAATKAGR